MRNKVVNFLNKGKSSVKSHRNLILQSVYSLPPELLRRLQLFMLVKIKLVATSCISTSQRSVNGI